MSLRSERAVQIGLALYSILILGSQATMSIGIGILLAFAVYGVGGPAAFWRRVRETARTPEMRLYLWATNFVTLACFLSLLFADLAPVVLAGQRPEVRWVKDLWKAWYFYWPLAVAPCLLALSPEGRRRVLRIFLFTFGIVSVIGCAQFFTGWPRVQGIPGFYGRFHVTGFPGHHLSYASIMIFPFFLAVSEIFDQRWIERRWAIPMAVIGAAAIFGTYSRQVWISLPIGLFAYAVVRLPRRSAIAVFTAGLALIVGVLQIPAIRERAAAGMGVSDRLSLWKINIEFFKMRPLTGVGWHHNLQMAGAWYREFKPEVPYPFIGHAHSNFFEFLGGLGLIGVVAYLVWTWATVRLSYRAGAGFFAAWIVFHLNGLTQVNLWESKVMHSMMWSVSLFVVALVLAGSRTGNGSREK
jgi:O-antigen ligase